jgi:hypothetical protein
MEDDRMAKVALRRNEIFALPGSAAVAGGKHAARVIIGMSYPTNSNVRGIEGINCDDADTTRQVELTGARP